MRTNYKRATRYGTRSPVVDEDRGRLAWQRLLKPFAVVVACNWVAFIATNEVLSYYSLCQLWIQANFGCCCCRFSSFSLRPSIDVAPDGHVGRWTSSPLLHAVEASGAFLWHFLGTSGIYLNADQITKWSMMIRARTSASSSAMHEGVFSRLWWKSSVSGARGHRRLCHFSCSVKVNFNRHNLAKLRKKESYYFHKPPVRRRLGWQPVNDHRSVCAKRWLLVREDVAKSAANLIAICTVVLRQTWQYGVNRRCVPPFFFVHYPLPGSIHVRVNGVSGLTYDRCGHPKTDLFENGSFWKRIRVHVAWVSVEAQ